jgi:hypothetical protein
LNKLTVLVSGGGDGMIFSFPPLFTKLKKKNFAYLTMLTGSFL